MAKLVIRVVDADTGAPIPFLTVGIGGIRAETNREGVIELDLPPGTYVLQCRPPFYFPVRTLIRVPGTYVIRVRSMLLGY